LVGKEGENFVTLHRIHLPWSFPMITFLYPQVLWLLFLALIPIIIHLINLHRHKVLYFSRLSFLKKVENKSKRTRKIHNLLILLLRTLTIVFLVLAFAFPRLNHRPNEQIQQADHIILFLDNSLSMQTENRDGSFLMQAKNYIIRQLSSISNSVSFRVLTHQGIVARNINPGALQQVIQPIDYSATVIPPKQLTEFLRQQLAEISKGNESVKVLIISDFQKNYWSPFFDLVDSLPAQIVRFSTQNYDNISIDTVWFDSPYRLLNVEQGLFVRLTNRGENFRQGVPVRLYLNDSIKSLISVDLEGGESKNLFFSFSFYSEGWYSGKIEIDDNPVVFDDTYYFTFEITRRRKVILVGDEQYYLPLKRLFDAARYIDYKIIAHNNLSVDQFDSVTTFFITQPERLAQGVFDQILQRVSKGAALAMFLDEPFDRVAESRILNNLKLPALDAVKEQKSSVKILSLQHPLFRRSISNIDKEAKLPVVLKLRKFQHKVPQAEAVLVTENADPVLLERRFDMGGLYLITTDILKNDDFTTNPLFVPLFVNMVQFSGKVIEPVFTLTDNICFEFPAQNLSKDQVPKIIDKHKRSFIPRFQSSRQNIMICPENQIQESGIYSLFLADNAPFLLSMNYSRLESDFTPLDIEGYKSKGFELFNTKQRIDNEKGSFPLLWQFFLILGLLCFVAELWILTSEKNSQ